MKQEDRIFCMHLLGFKTLFRKFATLNPRLDNFQV